MTKIDQDAGVRQEEEHRYSLVETTQQELWQASEALGALESMIHQISVLKDEELVIPDHEVEAIKKMAKALKSRITNFEKNQSTFTDIESREQLSTEALQVILHEAENLNYQH